MSYRPDNQALEEHIDKMLEGLRGFREAVHQRFQETGGDRWSDEHLQEIGDLATELSAFEFRLAKVKSDTW